MTWRDRFLYWSPRVALFLLAWTAVWLVLTAQLYMMVAASQPRPIRVSGIALGQLVRVVFWMPSTFLVIWAFRHWRITGSGALPATLKHLALSLALMFANHAFRIMYFQGVFSGRSFDRLWQNIVLGFNGVVATDLAIYWGIIGLLALKAYAQREQSLEVTTARLQASLSEAQLRALQGQMKPHFIHNALNAVAALVKDNKPDAAVDTLAHISALLRTLSDAPGRNLVPLGEEEQFIRRLLAIEQVRFGAKLEARIEIAEDCRGVLVPNLVLQPLVENAIKHGISRRTRPGRVLVRARGENGRLILEVFNDGPKHAASDDKLVHGVGLASLVQRLECIYGTAAEATFDFKQEEEARVTLRLPLQPTYLPA